MRMFGRKKNECSADNEYKIDLSNSHVSSRFFYAILFSNVANSCSGKRMINKRPYGEEDSYEVASKHPRRCASEVAPVLDFVPCRSDPQKSFSGMKYCISSGIIRLICRVMFKDGSIPFPCGLSLFS